VARAAWGRLRKARRVVSAQNDIASELETIQETALDMPEFAIEGLLEVASNAIQVLESVCAQYPACAKASARNRKAWPVMASRSRSELLAIQGRLRVLQVGEDAEGLADVKVSGSTARCYAEAVYETLSENRELHVLIQRLYEDPDFQGTSVNAPKWAIDCAALPTFNSKNFKAWWGVAEVMLRDQCADLVHRPEWANTTRHSVCRNDFGELRIGTAQTRILGAIKDALHNLAAK
jgi:hypothetical protein